jgi:hypothetical protein
MLQGQKALPRKQQTRVHLAKRRCSGRRLVLLQMPTVLGTVLYTDLDLLNGFGGAVTLCNTVSMHFEGNPCYWHACHF